MALISSVTDRCTLLVEKEYKLDDNYELLVEVWADTEFYTALFHLIYSYEEPDRQLIPELGSLTDYSSKVFPILEDVCLASSHSTLVGSQYCEDFMRLVLSDYLPHRVKPQSIDSSVCNQCHHQLYSFCFQMFDFNHSGPATKELKEQGFVRLCRHNRRRKKNLKKRRASIHRRIQYSCGQDATKDLSESDIFTIDWYLSGMADGARKGNNKDKISNLNDDEIDLILGYLLVPEVVRTSVLSKRWRHCWRRCKILDFGEDFFERYIRHTVYKLDNTIRTFLSHHDGSVDKFRLDLPSHIYISFDPSEWITLLPLKRISYLSICASKTSPYPLIPSDIFTCSDLQHLELSFCWLGSADKFNGFSKLISLELENCFMPDDLLKILISNSPLLEKFKLYHEDDDIPVTINFPHLKSLSLNFDEYLRPAYLENCPELEFMYLYTNMVVPMNQGKASKLEQFVCLLPKIETLYIGGVALSSLAAGHIPSRLPTTLQNLERLDVIFLHIYSPEQIACTFSLIRSSPYLQSVEFSFDSFLKEGKQAAANYLESQRREVDIWYIETVTLDNFSEPKHGVLFAHIILDRCPHLDAMNIFSRFSLDRDEEVELLTKLMDHPRSSIMIVTPANEGIMDQVLATR